MSTVMAERSASQIERRALDLFERLISRPHNERFRARMLNNEHGDVLARLAQLERVAIAKHALPTDLPNAGTGVGRDAPERFGPFKLVSPIGSGGMGEVWLGQRDDGLYEQQVAIKLIQSHLQIRAGAAFETERRILARLEHPDIARLIDGGQTPDGRSCLVMEYVDGVPFDEGCARLSRAQTIELFKQAASAVDYAHGRLIAHGDLKPSNILVDREGRIRLLDFGIARFVTEDAGAFRSPGAVTTSFASPQRLGGDPPSIPDDVFALGKLLALTLEDKLDPELAAIADKATADDEASRYGAIADLLADLERWKSHRPVSALAPTLRYRAQKYVRRNWKLLLAGGVLGLAATVALANYVRAVRSDAQAERERAEASDRFDDARGAARYLLFTLYDQLEERPNSLGLRREVAATAQHYLDRLATSRSTLPEVRLEAAQGLLRLSQVQASPLIANLGEPEASKRNLEAALRLLHPLDGIAARRTEALAELDAANLAEMVEENQDAAWRHLSAARALLAADRDAPAPLKGQYFVILSTIERWNNHFAQAGIAAQQALALLSHDTQLTTLMLRGRAVELLGDAIDNMDRHAAAEAQYEQSLAIAEQAAALYPGSYYAHRRLAIAYYHVGIMAVRWGDPNRGLALLERASREGRESVAREPADDSAQRSLRIDEDGRAQALVLVGRIDDGLSLMAHQAASLGAIWHSRPNELRRMRDYALDQKELGDLQARYRRFESACASYRESRRVFEAMGSQGHLSAADRTAQLGEIIGSQARYCGT
jgi:serine/threonine-protein kinase